MTTSTAWSMLRALPVTVLSACVVAAAGAGAGGGIYLTQRGVESVVPVTVDRAASATDKAFADLKIRRTQLKTEQGDQYGPQKEEVQGTADDRDITVTLNFDSPNSTRVQVVAKKSAVTWDKDYARTILDKIVAYSR